MGPGRPEIPAQSCETTLSGKTVQPLDFALPKRTLSLCPECLATIPAVLEAEDGRVMMRKSCPAHGTFSDVVFSDVELYLRMGEWYFGDGKGFSNPAEDPGGDCPERCGICGFHTCHTSLANVDLTSRCNMSCGVCFANANRAPFDLSFDQAVEILRRFRAQRPAPAFAVQFSGGEPTLHPRFLDIVSSARELGFSHIQVATNGLKFADADFAARAREAGLQYLYLQMDGVTDDVFLKFRGKALFETKLRIMESARRAGLRIVFVPTVARGVNDHQIGDLYRLAFRNLDLVSGISFQPLSFIGRRLEADRLKARFTLSDLAREFSLQTGVTHPVEDWFPLNSAGPLVRFAGAVSGTDFVNHACHPHCGLMTLLFVDDLGSAVPVTRFLDLLGLLKAVDRLTGTTGRMKANVLSRMKALHAFHRFFDGKKAPKGLNFYRFLKTLDGFADKKYSWGEEHKGHTYKTFYLLAMHFMDGYNFDLERVSRCGVHYAGPDGRIYPFCTYNAGPAYRNRVENGIANP